MRNRNQMGPCARDFFQAAVEGDEDGILMYIKDGYDVNDKYEYDEIGKEVSALMLASTNGHVDCVKTLLGFGADISDLSQQYTKAILYASQQNELENLKTLAAAGMFGDKYDGDIVTCYKELVDCVLQGDFEKVKNILLDTDLSEQVGRDELWVSAVCFLILSGCPKCDIDQVVEKFEIDVNGYNSRGFTPLISAIIAGNLELLDYLIEKGADVNKQEDLMRHAKDIECAWVESMVTFKDERGGGYPPLNIVLDSDEKCPVMFAVWTGKLDIVKRLLAVENIDVGCSDSQKGTVLVHAVYAGQLDIVDELLCYGVDIHKKHSETGRTVLFEAVNAGREDILKRISDAGVDKGAMDRFGMTAMLYASEAGKSKTLKVLLECGDFNVNEIDLGNSQYSALMHAAHNKRHDCLKLLLDNGADVCIRNAGAQTVFSVATEFGDVKCLTLLIEESFKVRSDGTRINHKEIESELERCLQFASRNKDKGLLKMILPYCKTINRMDESGYTALMSAASVGETETMKLLLENGADVNIENEDEETAIWLALEAEEMDCFELLIEAGANITYVPEECEMLLVYSARLEDIRYLEILLEKGPQLLNKICRSSQYSPLTAALSYNRLENVQLLLEKGADVNLCDDKGNPPVMYAARWPDGLKLLLEAGANLDTVDKYDDTVWFPVTQSWECLKMVLEDGSVFEEGSDPKKLKSVHKDCGINMSHMWDVRSLKLLFEYGIFEWDWYVFGEQIKQIDKIAFAALNVQNSSPFLFEDEDEEGKRTTTSMLQQAFLGENIGTIRYLMANLFMTLEDYRALVSDSDFRIKMREKEKEEDEDTQEVISFLNRVTSQPLRLETLSFLVISSSLTASPSSCHQQRLSRSERVDTLALPEILKSKLKFENAVRKLCPTEWLSIGKLSDDQEEDLLAVVKPLRPCEQDLTECDEECTLCHGCGYQYND